MYLNIAICNNIAEISSKIATRILGAEVYILGCVNPNYAKGNDESNYFIHYMNAFIQQNKITYFDNSVYINIFDPKSSNWVSFKNTSFDPLNISSGFIFWEKHLQDRNNFTEQPRTIELKEIGDCRILLDSYAGFTILPDFYQKVDFINESFLWVVENGRIVKREMPK